MVPSSTGVCMSTDYDYDFIVIGSGFGGSVSALRLSEKGYSVAVLEMGKRFSGRDFAKTNWNVRKYLWLPQLMLYGIQQITLLKNVLIFHGAGVGGGSLVYANTLLVPPEEAFRDPRWPSDEDWDAKLAPHYRTARFMLGAVEASELFPADYLLKDVVKDMTGQEVPLHRHTVGVYFGEADRRVDDPFFGGEGPARTGCNLCGECMTGCKNDAKNTLDKNYLHLAEQRGCVIHPETRVTDVRPLAEGGYVIQTEHSTALFAKRPKVYRARGVVFSASVLGTVKLLFQCKERGSLPELSEQLGSYVRTNSEAILAARTRDTEVDYSHGIAITSGVHPDENTHVEIVRYGKGQDFMATMMTLLTGGGEPWPRWLRWLGNMARHPIRFLRATLPCGWARHTAMVLMMQPVDNHMKLRMRNKLWRRTLDSELEEGQSVPTYTPLANDLTTRLAKKMNGTPQSLILEVLANTSSTAHILGGATMARSPVEGVCDARGRVFGYEDMYVADGSIVPANLGVNPSLTITALSEYVMSGIPDKPGAETRPAPRAPATG